MAENQDTTESRQISKKAQKKQERQKAKDEHKRQNQDQLLKGQSEQVLTEDYSKEYYGNTLLNQSQSRPGRIWTEIKELDLSKRDSEVLVRGRMHNSRMIGEYDHCSIIFQFL
ncbi:Aspartate--tRNA ligase, cytoplasmic-like [Oopsacas minuta]|uniref:Aspartate--tRNA ligase, cytoplasmic-like n=1 Tax=Oopsacas minuta TaxID=111878 RepID=A0AAV7JAX9_9METZ|nr:Aspartate--tRNA ligase, cytoplasmic-like [Oopsacas minuta]